MGFFGGLFGGSNDQINSDINQSAGVAGFGTGVGEGAVQSGLGFEEGLLSGNQAQEAQLLAPEIGNIQKQGQQQIQTAAQFGNRSGGTNASAQNDIDTQRSQVNDMVAKLTGNAAGAVMNEGNSLLGTGLKANQINEKEAQQRMENQKNSILGQGITNGVNAGEDFVGGGLAGLASGGSFMGGGAAALGEDF
jgi:hypothetical protein